MLLPEPVSPTTAREVAGGDVEVDAGENGALLSGVSELDVLEAQLAADLLQADRLVGLGDVDLQVEVLEDPLEEGEGGLHLHAGGEQADRGAEEALLEGDEGDQGAQ